MSEERPGSTALLGIGAGLATACMVGGLVGFLMMAKAKVDGRKGWNLVPVVVAAQDIPAGTVVTFDLISQRSLPEQFVTASQVKPDSASYIVNQTIVVEARPGDPLLWSSFEVSLANKECLTLADSLARKLGKPPSPALSQLLGAMRSAKGGAAKP